MKAIMIMFDTLRRKALPAYGNEWVKAPNFKRLQEKTVTFDNFYAGSLPCMPARRELHTGRYNFLHRSWGPLEPFDDSMPDMLKRKGVYSHLVTDHSHYFEDGGCTYHNRYNSWEGFRGQEGDRWKGHIGDIKIPEQLETVKGGVSFKQNWVNRSYQKTEEEFSTYKTFEAGLEFMDINKNQDNWFLQIECFDPHEPFYTPEKYRKLYPHKYDGKHFDWPSYQPVSEDKGAIEHVNLEYAALVSMCDAYLGKVLDYMDENDMWKDTMLIVNTDHGFLMGEHEWWGKNIQPFYNEVVHLPFFLWDPRVGINNERRDALTQTIDIAPTLLDYFGADIPQTMQGKPLRKVLTDDEKIRDAALFGAHGGHINVTDGKFVYMRSAVEPKTKELYEYTLMPTVMRDFFKEKQLVKAELTTEFEFAKELPVLKVPANSFISSFRFGNKLYDIESDKDQLNNIDDIEKEMYMVELLRKAMLESEAPNEQYSRVGIYKEVGLTKEEIIKQREERVNKQQFKIDRDVAISPKANMQLNFIKDMMPEAAAEKLINQIEKLCDENKLTEVNEEIVLNLANSLLDKLNLGDKKGLIINLLKYIDKAN